MESPSITVHEIESAAVYRDHKMIESSVHVPLLECDVALVVYFDPDHNSNSDRQLDRLNQLLSVGKDRLTEVKTQLFDRWGEYDHFYSDDIEFEYSSPDESYAVCKISGLYLHDVGAEYSDSPVFSFSVEWDPEHGAKVRFHKNNFEWCL